jgi:Phosphotransferase enzyme family
VSRGVADPERVASDVVDTTPKDQGAMDWLLRLTSADHLNAILEKAGVLGGLHVQDVSIISDRPTLASRIIRLRLTYDGPANALPGSLIVKTGLLEQRENEWSGGHKQVAFYSDVAPSLPPGVVPRCFDAHLADATTPWHLVLEDLTDTHTLATEWPLPPSEAQCRTIIGSLGRFHAAWWEDPRLGVTVGARLDDAAIDRLIRLLVGHFDVFADRLGDELSGERRAFYERLIAAAPRLLRNARNSTLGHGDAHVWNCFLPRNGSDDVRWFDWDAWGIRPPTSDLAYMMALHWYPERRQRLERALLDHYHTVLLENGVRNYDRIDMQEDYRRSVLWRTTIPVFQAGLELPPFIWWSNFQRIMAAVDDLGCRELLD